MENLHLIVDAIERHAVEDIKRCFENGVNPNEYYNNKPLVYELISEYTRTPRFKDCFKAFVDYGVTFSDKPLMAVLLDDAITLESLLIDNPDSLNKKYSLICAYTPIFDATLLHICAEFNHVSCAEVLVKYGVDVNAPAGIDENGFGGQTPIFHTVNQNSNNSIHMLHYLLSHGADIHITVPGIIWGKSYEWETLIPAVNPVSYAMMGLLPQMHRDEVVITKVVALLLKKAYGIQYTPRNIPNAYLKKDKYTPSSA